MRQIFIDKNLETEFRENGFVIVNLFNKDDMNHLLNITKEFGYVNQCANNAIRSSFIIEIDNPDKMKKIFNSYAPIIKNRIDNYLYKYNPVRTLIFEKGPGGGMIPVHNHPTLVDETIFCSLSIWVPLVKTNITMGVLHIIKKSHRISNHIRCFAEKHKITNSVSQNLLDMYATPVLLNPGEVIMFDDRLIHWSPPNKSNSSRIAINFMLAPEEANLEIYYRKNKQEITKYSISKYILCSIDPSRRKPDGLLSLGNIKQDHIEINDDEFYERMKILDVSPVNKPKRILDMPGRFLH